MPLGDPSQPGDPSELGHSNGSTPSRPSGRADRLLGDASERAAAAERTDRAVDLTPTPPGPGAASGVSQPAHDPLRLCIFATVALLAWVTGPWALAFFAGRGFVGYWRARRAGLLRSRCLLGDTRLALLYLGILAAVAVAAIAWSLRG